MRKRRSGSSVLFAKYLIAIGDDQDGDQDGDDDGDQDNDHDGDHKQEHILPMSGLVVLQRNRSSALFDKHLIRNTIIMITAGTLIIIVKEQRHWSSALFGKHTLLASSHSSL